MSDDEDFYGKYDVIKPEMDMFGMSRRETIISISVMVASVIFFIAVFVVMVVTS